VIVLVGIGCDCIEIDRFRQAVQRSGTALLHRLFTEEEILICQRNADPIFSFAGRFAAKEALSKALGTGIGSELSWKEMEIINDPKGRPLVRWHIDIKARYGVQTTHLTISHSHTIAMAYAVLER
jgi:holo-[acyl-carrier protein] synthase